MNPNSNITPIESKQAQPSCRFTIQATLRGFPITIEGEGRAGDLKLIIDRLLDSGAEPPAATKPEPTKQSGVPTCPVYNSQMKPSRKPGKFYCAKKVGEDYCQEVA